MLASALLAMTGCQSAPPVKAGGTQPSGAVKVTPVDVCAGNLHELCGLLLQYYLIHQNLPPRLEDAAVLADALQPVSLQCSVSGKAYRYSVSGLVAQGELRRVVVLDPEASHDGSRWAIVTVPREGTTPLGLWVVKLSETAAQQYHEIAQ